jgi:hypothetical protein
MFQIMLRLPGCRRVEFNPDGLKIPQMRQKPADQPDPSESGPVFDAVQS